MWADIKWRQNGDIGMKGKQDMTKIWHLSSQSYSNWPPDDNFLKACSNNTKKLQREKLKSLFISSAMSFKQKEDRDNRVQTDTAFLITIRWHLVLVMTPIYSASWSGLVTCSRKHPEQALQYKYVLLFQYKVIRWKPNASHRIYETFRRFWGKNIDTISCFFIVG